MSIFTSAVEHHSPDQWGSFLDDACGGDVALRHRVDLLLRAHQGEDSFLDRGDVNEASDTVDRPIAEQAGTVTGPYKLLQQIGEGGMGVVFMAEQTEPIQRTVALKIIKPGMDTRQVIARFEAERQALAMMDHPNIAKVLDAGATGTGRPYFVMELVKGVPITKFCDDHKLSLRQRLVLFKPICEAVQHAHQKGVIHRDLKPTNVLVAEYDSRAVPKVIDFGVAKATAQKLTERTMFTEFGQVIGTVEYMSPEQAKFNQLDIDTRSDIYSLGVLLYELLTGSTPLERQRLRNAAFDEVLRIIREEEPPKPSTRLTASDTLPAIAANRHSEPARLTKDVRGELDWIVMKCLEKDRNRRYETANGLMCDIERFLNDEPVQAYPPSQWYQLRMFYRRNKAPAVAASLIAMTLLLGTATTAWQAVRATSLAAREATLRERAETREAIAKAGRHSDAGEMESADALVKDIPDESLEMYADAVAPVIHVLAHWHAGEKRWRESSAYYHALLFGPARHITETRDKSRRPDGDISTTGDRQPSSMIYFEFAPLLVELHDTARYEALRTLAIERNAQTYDPVIDERMLHACLLSPVSESQMITICKWAHLATALDNGFDCSALALFEYRRGRDDQALLWARKGLSKKESNGTGLGTRLHLVSAMAHAQLNQREQAETELAKCRSEIDSKFASNLGVGNVGGNLWADWLINRVLLHEAQALFADGISKTHLAERTTSKSQQWDAAMVRARLELSSEISQLADASIVRSLTVQLATCEDVTLREPRIALELAQQAVQQKPHDSRNWTVLGQVQLANGNWQAALDAYDKAIELQPSSAQGYNSSAWFLATAPEPNVRNSARAVDLAKKAVELAPKDGNIWNTLGVVQYRAGDWQASIDSLEKAIDLRKGGGDAFDWFFLAMGNWQIGDHDKARVWYDKAVGWMDKNQPENIELIRFRAEADQLLGLAEKPASNSVLPDEGSAGYDLSETTTLRGVIDVLQRHGKQEEAAKLIHELLSIQMDTNKKRTGNDLKLLTSAARTLQDKGNFVEAETLQRDVIQRLRVQPGVDEIELATRLSELALTLLLAEKYDAAEPIARESLVIRERKLPGDWRTCYSQSLLGGSLMGQKKYAAAEPLLLAGYNGMKKNEDKIAFSSRRRLRDALARLVDLYQGKGTADEVARWQHELAQFDKTEKQKKNESPLPEKTSKSAPTTTSSKPNN